MKDNKDDYMKFSVLVLTYNPVLSNVLFTLDSIVNQKFDDFEIVDYEPQPRIKFELAI